MTLMTYFKDVPVGGKFRQTTRDLVWTKFSVRTAGGYGPESAIYFEPYYPVREPEEPEVIYVATRNIRRGELIYPSDVTPARRVPLSSLKPGDKTTTGTVILAVRHDDGSILDPTRVFVTATDKPS